jgi:hypothetical protein
MVGAAQSSVFFLLTAKVKEQMKKELIHVSGKRTSQVDICSLYRQIHEIRMFHETKMLNGPQNKDIQ